MHSRIHIHGRTPSSNVCPTAAAVLPKLFLGRKVQRQLPTNNACSPHGIPVVRVEVSHGYYRLCICLFSPQFYLTVFSIKSPTPSIFRCCSPFSSHFFHISVNAVLPSHSRSSSPPVPLHFLGSFSSPILSA